MQKQQQQQKVTMVAIFKNMLSQGKLSHNLRIANMFSYNEKTFSSCS